MIPAVKFADPSRDDIIQGYGMPNGGPFSGNDLAGEHFSERTDFCTEWFPESRPLIFQHGLDAETGTTVVGRVKSYARTDLGMWVQAQLDRSSEYFGAIKDLVAKGKLFFSSAAMPHLVEVDRKSGEILRWPWVELSLTPTPCNPDASLDFATADKHYKAINLTLPDAFKAEMDAEARNALSDADFAYVDAEGGRHLPINDAAHVRAAMARWNQTGFQSEEAKAEAKRKIIAAAHKFDVEVSSDFAAKALQEGSDSAGGFLVSKEPTPTPLADGPAHDEMRSHAHTHADGTTHAHAHMHPGDQADHDTLDHGHTVLMQAGADARKAAFPVVSDDEVAEAGEGSYENLRDDLQELLNPTSPFGAAAWTHVLWTYPGFAIACRHGADDDDGETFWRVDYTIGPDQEPVITKVTQLKQTYEPVAPKSWGPLTLDALDTTRRASALAQRTQDLSERRLKEGRVISAASRQSIQQAIEAMQAAEQALSDLLQATERTQAEQAKAAYLGSPKALALRLRLANDYLATLD